MQIVKAIIFAILVGAAAYFCLSAPVRSMLGATETEIVVEDDFPENPTAADYIQDGLVAMWDGIENVGWGEHDDHATEWVELAGAGCPMVVSNLTGCTWEDRCLTNPTESSITIGNIGGTWAVIRIDLWYQEIGLIAAESTDTYKYALIGDYTNEFVGSPGNEGYMIIKASRIFDFRYAYVWNSHRIVWTPSNNWGSENYRGYVFSNEEIEESRPILFSGVAMPDKGGILYANGNYIRSSTNACETLYNRRYASQIIIPSKASLHCMRLYNRALSPDEIAYNYRIDRLRFNLP